MAHRDWHMAPGISSSAVHVLLHWGAGICTDPIHSSIKMTAI